MKNIKKITSLFLVTAITFSGVSFTNTAKAATASLTETEPNDSFATANVINIPTAGTYEFNGSFLNNGNADYIKIEFSNAGKFNVSIKNITSPETKLSYEVYDSEFNSIDWEYGYPHAANSVYYIQPMETTIGSHWHDYSVTITEDESIAYEQEYNDTTTTANLLTENLVLTGCCGTSLDTDYYKLVIPNGYYAKISFGPTAEADLGTLYSGWTVDVITNTNSRSSQSSIMTDVTLNNTVGNTKNFYAGTHYVVVSRTAIGNGNPYHLSYKLYKYNAPKLSNLSIKNKIVTVKWKKDKTATGYQIQYSLKKNFKSSKSVSKKANTVGAKIKKLKKGKKYYIRIRSYKLIGKKKNYSNWSNVKTVKVK